MKWNLMCDECGTEFKIDELEIKESTVNRRGQIERCIVQYFTCPKCKLKYIVMVYDDVLDKLIKEHKKFTSTPFQGSPEKYKKMEQSLQNRISAETTMLMHLYKKQHKEDRFSYE